jgi:integrase
MPHKLFKFKNSPYWYVDFGKHQGRRLRTSTGPEDKKQAEAYAKHRQSELWAEEKLGKRPTVIWDQVIIEWLKEHSENRSADSIEFDKQRLRVLSQYLKGRDVELITPADIKNATSKIPGVGASTRNRYITNGIAILNFAHAKHWRTSGASREDFPEAKHRIRYLTPDEAQRLLAKLPEYLRSMAEFSLATGLREANVRLLEWANVDMGRSIAWVHADQAKGRKSLAVPLNVSAMDVLDRQSGLHRQWVFPLNDRPVSGCSNKSWRSALKRAGIENFRWHDLRHTWASWHVQKGTSLYDLKTLGGWASMTMVERYAHMTHERVAKVSR